MGRSGGDRSKDGSPGQALADTGLHAYRSGMEAHPVVRLVPLTGAEPSNPPRPKQATT